MSKRYVATKVLTIRGSKIGTGNLIPEDIEPSRLSRLIRLGSVTEQGAADAPKVVVPNENVNKAPAGDAAQSPSKSSEDERVEALDDDADVAENAIERDEAGSEFPKHVGAGTWELSDGARISKDEGGKEVALKQQALLDALDADEIS